MTIARDGVPGKFGRATCLVMRRAISSRSASAKGLTSFLRKPIAAERAQVFAF